MTQSEQIQLKRKISDADHDVLLGLATLIHGTCEKVGVQADIQPLGSLGITVHAADTSHDAESSKIDSLSEPIAAELGALTLVNTANGDVDITVQVVSADLVAEVQSLGSIALPGVAKLSLATVSRDNAQLINSPLYKTGLDSGIHGIPITLQEACIAS